MPGIPFTSREVRRTDTKDDVLNMDHNSDTREAPSKWQDPSVPVGNGPPTTKWNVALFGAVWVGWVAFLFAMMLSVRNARG